jgi:asparagine synthetase B (glutamine-hydrolysing)
MCGLVGFIRLNENNKQSLDVEYVKKGFREAQKRGMQATGMYSPSTGVVKVSGDTAEFFREKDKEFLKALNGRFMLGHCRAATSGLYEGDAGASNLANNHPHESEHWVLIHNGHFDDLPLVKGYKYRGHCDSEIALSYIETFGPELGCSLLCNLDGFSLVFANKDNGDVYFYRNDKNPLIVSWDCVSETLFFGSTEDTVQEMVDWVDVNGLTLYAGTMPNSTVSARLYKCVTSTTKSKITFQEIKCRETNHSLRNLPKETKDMLEIENFFRLKNKEEKVFIPSYNGRQHSHLSVGDDYTFKAFTYAVEGEIIFVPCMEAL